MQQVMGVHIQIGPKQAQIAKMGKLYASSLMVGMREKLVCPFLPHSAPHIQQFQEIILDK